MVVIRGALYVKNYVEWKEIENMLRVIEAFSGIGAQKQALLDSGIEHEIINTIEWDINAIYAYDKMHNGDKEPSKHSKPEILEKLSHFTKKNQKKKNFKSNKQKKITTSIWGD
ncbi:hypothetical protein [Pseudolactococcus laudensis]|uniref:hypothetical protein n=1 Tax=Pseudolactococcus laudensis TaxID=1494461 RepID=UPI002FCC0F20